LGGAYLILTKLTLGTALLLFGTLGSAQIPIGAPTGNISTEAPVGVPPFSSDFSAQDVLSQRAKSESGIQNPQLPGNISGTVIDRSGKVSVGANVRLTYKGRAFGQQVASGNNGQFFFSGVPPGNFQLTVSAPGFMTQVFSGALRPGQVYLVPPIVLGIETVQTNVQVRASTADVAQAQVKEQEKQRILSIIPNFFVTYLPNPAPLNPRQKFRLSLKTAVDPFTFVGAGIYAGIEQAGDRYPEYGQGAAGYAKRYGAGYADAVAGIFIGNAILPSLLKQDPRYFYKGTGTKRSRLLYALASSVICKGDNMRWQPNYSFMLGSIAVGGISNLYVPASDRNGAGLIFQNALIRIGQGSLGGVLQEFLIPRLTPHVRRHQSAHSSQDHKTPKP
jgi:Carboxypeptidase regulatory-like domain